jgi:hypothetical protein
MAIFIGGGLGGRTDIENQTLSLVFRLNYLEGKGHCGCNLLERQGRLQSFHYLQNSSKQHLMHYTLLSSQINKVVYEAYGYLTVA